MDEQNNHGNHSMNGGQGKVCSCGCGCGWMGGHRISRIVLALVILLIAFWVGVKAGELRVELRTGMGGVYGIGGPRMYPYPQYPINYYTPGGVPIMQGPMVPLSSSSAKLLQ